MKSEFHALKKIKANFLYLNLETEFVNQFITRKIDQGLFFHRLDHLRPAADACPITRLNDKINVYFDYYVKLYIMHLNIKRQ